MNRIQKIREIIYRIRYQMSYGIHTYSNCSTEGCDTRSRGGGKCESCLTEELGEIVGIEEARKFYFTQETLNALENSFYEKAGE